VEDRRGGHDCGRGVGSGKVEPRVTTPFSSMAWVLMGSFVGSFGALFLKIGAGKLEKNFRALITNWRLAMGIGFYLLSSVLFIMGVRKGELSILYPMVSLGSVWTMFWSRLFLGEPLTRAKFVALGMILVGVTLLGLGSR
jgi:drug/metabolite transporter (DMT)-like permease